MHVVPFIDLSRSVKLIRERVLQSWTDALDECGFVGGPAVQKLERQLEQKLKVPHFIACSNGTDALVVALQGIGIKPGMKVAMPNMTFWAPYEAIVQIGAVPVLVDIDPNDLQMCFQEFCKGHEEFKFDAAILPHLFGWCSSKLKDYRDYCQEQNIDLIEDGAQCFGVEVGGESVYSQAQVSTISFYPAKVLGGAGDGGGVMTKDPVLAEKIRALCNHGRAGHYTYDYVGWNNRMSGTNAHYMLHMLDIIDELVDQRRAAEKFYIEYFSDYSDRVKVFSSPEGVLGNGYLCTIQSLEKTGDELAAGLKNLGIGCARTYPQTICQQPPAQKALRTSDLQVSQEFSKMVINLPLFAGITEEECLASAKALQSLL